MKDSFLLIVSTPALNVSASWLTRLVSDAWSLQGMPADAEFMPLPILDNRMRGIMCSGVKVDSSS
jgi:hypothetical protein